MQQLSKPADLPAVVSVLLDAIPTAVFLKDVAGRFSGVNRSYERISGMKRGTIMGKTVFELYPHDLAQRYQQADDALYAAGGTQTYEVPMVTASGDRRDMFVSKSVLHGPDGGVVGLIGTFTDLSEQREAERALREANERLEQRIEDRTRALATANTLLTATLESTADGILAVDHQHKVVARNERFLKLWGIDPLLVGSTDEKRLLEVALTRVRDPAAFGRRVEEIYATTSEAADRIELEDGRTFERYSIPLKVANEPPGRVWSFRDITRERELELEMRHAQKMEAVGRLAGGVAHDFNNLLTVILGSASAVQDTLGQDHAAQPDVADISAAVKRAAELTRQLLTFSRKQAFGSQRVDLNAVLKDMLRMLTRLLGEDVAIDLHCADALGPVNVDRGQLEQVIANLCVNARDAMPAGGRIVVSTRRVPADACPLPMPLGGAELTITDTGTGITAEVREHMFEPFYTTKERGKGTGLGLSTVYGIVKQSGGAIDVESTVGRGTTFRVVLPLAATLTPMEEPRAPARSHRGTASVLLVEDEASLRKGVSGQLQRAGYAVTEAIDGVNAEEVARTRDGPFDLLLTDLVMPRRSGIELARNLSREGKVRHVIFMSGFVPVADQLPVDAVLVAKPFHPEALLQRIAEVLAQPAAPLAPDE